MNCESSDDRYICSVHRGIHEVANDLLLFKNCTDRQMYTAHTPHLCQAGQRCKKAGLLQKRYFAFKLRVECFARADGCAEVFVLRLQRCAAWWSVQRMQGLLIDIVTSCLQCCSSAVRMFSALVTSTLQTI